MLLLFVIEIVFVVGISGVHSLLVAFLFARVNEQEEEGQGRCDESAKVIEYWRTSHKNIEITYRDANHQNQAQDPKGLHHDEISA